MEASTRTTALAHVPQMKKCGLMSDRLPVCECVKSSTRCRRSGLFACSEIETLGSCLQLALEFSAKPEERCLRKRCKGVLQTPAILVEDRIVAAQCSSPDARGCRQGACAAEQCTDSPCRAATSHAIEISQEQRADNPPEVRRTTAPAPLVSLLDTLPHCCCKFSSKRS